MKLSGKTTGGGGYVCKKVVQRIACYSPGDCIQILLQAHALLAKLLLGSLVWPHPSEKIIRVWNPASIVLILFLKNLEVIVVFAYGTCAV